MSGPRYGTDRVGQYKTHGIGDSIRARSADACEARFLVEYWVNSTKLKPDEAQNKKVS